MPEESKPFGEKVTGLLSGRFHDARLKLTAVYVVILAAILLISSSVIYSAFATQLLHRFNDVPPNILHLLPPPGNVLPRREDVLSDLILTLLAVNGCLLAIAGTFSHWLAGLTLKPIQDAYDRQRRFLGDASHELRTPLAILRTDIENQMDSGTLTQNSREHAQSNLEEVERMGRIVNDLLALSHLDEAEETDVEIKSLDVWPTILKSVERLKPLAEQHRVSLVTAAPEQPCLAAANESKLALILDNVIKNAILYNTANGSVTVTAKSQEDAVSINIKDTGIGIDAENLQRVFERFYRVDKSRSRQTGGSGLGLSIAQAAAEQLHGRMEIQSEPGKGTAVSLFLPAN